ncbi:unnamed protein product [Musa acuminata subsp. burmannicoides]
MRGNGIETLLVTTIGNKIPILATIQNISHFLSLWDEWVGKALFDGRLLDVHFSRSFYKRMLGIKVNLSWYRGF